MAGREASGTVGRYNIINNNVVGLVIRAIRTFQQHTGGSICEGDGFSCAHVNIVVTICVGKGDDRLS